MAERFDEYSLRMPHAFHEFPDGFLWGCATSAHQIEGGNVNDWSEWEQSEARLRYLQAQGHRLEDFISGSACESFIRENADFIF